LIFSEAWSAAVIVTWTVICLSGMMSDPLRAELVQVR
jgi:hypothetical protein